MLLCVGKNAHCREEIEMPPSPPIYRRGISREDTDVFSRLGAGIVNPTPGGSIKEFNGRVNKQKTCIYKI
jgi:hypothetical protein